MPPEYGSPEEWLRYAEGDLALAKAPLPERALRVQLCYHAQQAVEKAVKAVLIHLGMSFPKTHVIERLTGLLPDDTPRTDDLLAAADLTPYATHLRYPGVSEPVDDDEYREAVRLAEAAVAWAEEIIGEPAACDEDVAPDDGRTATGSEEDEPRGEVEDGAD